MKNLLLIFSICLILCGCLIRQKNPLTFNHKTGISKQEALNKLEEMKVEYTESSFLEKAQEGDIEVIRLFLAAGMSPNTNGIKNVFALILAIQEGQTEVIKELIEAGVNVNVDINGYSALLSAICSDQTETAMELIKAGANINAKNDCSLIDKYNSTELIEINNTISEAKTKFEKNDFEISRLPEIINKIKDKLKIPVEDEKPKLTLEQKQAKREEKDAKKLRQREEAIGKLKELEKLYGKLKGKEIIFQEKQEQGAKKKNEDSVKKEWGGRLSERKRVRYYRQFPAEKPGKIGVTTLLVWINSDGEVEQAKVLKSSGTLELDQLALDSIKKRTFRPSDDDQITIAFYEIDFRNIMERNDLLLKCLK